MNLAVKYAPVSKMDLKRFEKWRSFIVKQPTTVIGPAMRRKLNSLEPDNPEMYILSPQLYNMLISYAEIGQMLTAAGSAYSELKAENEKWRGIAKNTVNELARLKGEDYHVSDEFWHEVKNSQFDIIDRKLRPMPL